MSFQCCVYEANGAQVRSLVLLDLHLRVFPGPKRNIYVLLGHEWGGK